MTPERLTEITAKLTAQLFPHGGYGEVLELIAFARKSLYVREQARKAAQLLSCYADKQAQDAGAILGRAIAEVDPLTCPCYSCLEKRPATDGYPVPLHRRFMVVCEHCGNKRCPHATHHDNPCTGSNKPGQPGSRYQKSPIPEPQP